MNSDGSRSIAGDLHDFHSSCYDLNGCLHGISIGRGLLIIDSSGGHSHGQGEYRVSNIHFRVINSDLALSVCMLARPKLVCLTYEATWSIFVDAAHW